jgi:hypothetical protein
MAPAKSRWGVRAPGWLTAMLLLGSHSLAAADIRTVERGTVNSWSVLRLSGRIEPGDSDKLVAEIRKLPHPEFTRFARLMLDSPGGDYAEALRLGEVVRYEYVATRIAAGKSCIGACGFVFIGGGDRTNSDISEWLPEHELEAGGRLVFEGLTPETAMSHILGNAQMGDSVIGRMAFYLGSLGIDTQFFTAFLNLQPGARMPIEKVEQLRRLEVRMLGVPRLREVNDQNIVNLCNWATGWVRPLWLDPAIPQAPKAEVRALSFEDFKRNLLLRTLKGMEKDGPLAMRIREVAEHGDGAALDALYDEATALHILHLYSPSKSSRFYYVDGFEFGGGFYTMSCSIELDLGEKDRAPSAKIVEGQLVDDIPGDVHSYRAMGDVLYELYEPDGVLP